MRKTLKGVNKAYWYLICNYIKQSPIAALFVKMF